MFRVEVAKRQRLQAIGERSDEQAPRQGPGSAFAEKVAPFMAERLAVERPQALNDELDALRFILGRQRSHRSGRFTHTGSGGVAAPGTGSGGPMTVCGARNMYRVTPSHRSRVIGWPCFLRPVSAARVVCGSQLVAPINSSIVAPWSLRSSSMTSISFEPGRGTDGVTPPLITPELVVAPSLPSRPVSSRSTMTSDDSTLCGGPLFANVGSAGSTSIAASSTAMAFNPVAVSRSAKDCAVSSSRRQTRRAGLGFDLLQQGLQRSAFPRHFELRLP